ncbi:unnamed protein product, partial [marine sediment metagenome]
VLLFLGAAIVALFFQPQIIVDWIREFIEELIGITEGLNVWQMILYILQNNLKASFLGMIFGLILGVFPVFLALANGYVLGFVSEKVVQVEGFTSLWRLLPHGIFELPALFISLALGTKLGFFIFAKYGQVKQEFLRRLENSLRVFLFVVIPLLVIAAVIEGILIFLVS